MKQSLRVSIKQLSSSPISIYATTPDFMKTHSIINTTLFLLSILLCSCDSSSSEKEPIGLSAGFWRGHIVAQNEDIPFTFELVSKDSAHQIYLINASERLLLEEVQINGDSVYIPMHIFDADIKARLTKEGLVGHWTKNYEEDYRLPFKAHFGTQKRFETDGKQQEQGSNTDFSGRYDVTFVHEGTDTTKAVGLFEQEGQEVRGTFMTPTGDYRFLEGAAIGDSLLLSTFDGGHAFLFKAKKNSDGQLEGDFWSGKSWHESWAAVKNDSIMLPDANTLTFLKEGYDAIDFKFPNLNKKTVSPQDEKYKNKVLVLQIFGTWCPNCMDETRFLAPWYQVNHDRGVEILGLAYEAKDDFDYAKQRVMKMKEKLGVDYDMLIAGTKDKKAAAATLPMLNHVLSYPTTIFIGKDGKVKKIHTGFTGPGTGPYYEAFVKEFNTTIDELLEEGT